MSEELLPYEVLKPISYKGDRIEKGSIVHMTPEEAENIGDEFLEPAEEADNAEIPADQTDSEDNADKPTDPDEPEKPEDETKEDDKSSAENAEGTQTDNQPETV